MSCRGVRGALVLLLLAWIAACVGAPARQQPEIGVTPPQAWTAPEQAAGDVEIDWWTTFDDPSLVELVDIAVDQNRDLQVAVARLDQARAQARIAGADLKPTVDFSAQGTRQKQNFVGLPIPGAEGDVLSTTFTQTGASIVVGWEVDLWGRIRAGARAAVADAEASAADLRGARLSIAGQTAKTWFALAEAQQQLELAMSSAESFQGVADQVRSRYEKGVRPAVELRLALSNVAAAEAEVELRRTQFDTTLRQLEVLLGRYPAASLIETYAVRELPPTPPPVPAGLPAELVARRPDLVSAERRLAAADQRWVAARRALYPRLSLTASGGTSSAELEDLLDGDFSVWSLAANLAQPIFQGGRLRAGVELADAVADEALARYADSVLTAFAEVESALAAEQYLADREGHLAEAARQLVAAERLAQDRYRLGVGDYLAVLESQTRAFVAQSKLITLRRARLTNRIDLHLALGGGFEDTALDAASPGPSGEDSL
jgi:NodT family efflux transporter outer membrane factor (OMF) lipoprotein